MNLRILNLLEKSLNQSGLIDKNENVSFWCPRCKKEAYKKKLNICLNETSDKFGYWQCWVCGEENNMKGRTISSFLRKLNVNRKFLYELKKIIRVDYNISNNPFEIQNLNQVKIDLPEEFISLIDNKDNKAYKYLIGRGLTDYDIMKYNIGYCKSGKYNHYAIIPSYDLFGNLNYFVARTYDGWLPKYKNPSVPHKNFITINELFINWNMPILIVEGIFDMISAKRNVIPLLGKSIGDDLKVKLLDEDVKDVIIGLDPDAINTSMKYIESFITEGLNVKFININKDPSDLGFNKFISLYNTATNIDFENLIKLKMRT